MTMAGTNHTDREGGWSIRKGGDSSVFTGEFPDKTQRFVRDISK